MHDYTRHSWLLGMEAFETIASYSAAAAVALLAAASKAGSQLVSGDMRLPYDAFFNCLPADHLRFFESLRVYHQTADCLCTHGGLDPRVTCVEDQPTNALIWGTNGFQDSYTGDAVVVYGHWDNAVVSASGWPSPAIHRQTIGIDTISHGVLTAIRLPDYRVFQSRRHALRQEP